MSRIGLSPAFIVSTSTADFKAKDYLLAIRRAAAMAFDSLQLEILRPEALAEWTTGMRSEIRTSLADAGLVPSQFVAHFMLEDFRSLGSLGRRARSTAFQRFLDVAAAFPGCPVVTLPIPPFETAGILGPEAMTQARGALEDYLGGLLEGTAAIGKRLALELMPHALIGGTEGFLRLRSGAGLGALACNLDTGHAWARKEPVALLPALLGEALAGTHLCDNHGHESLKLRPGQGSIDFAGLLAGLAAAGYQGFLDLEILCPPAAVEREYAAGRAFLAALEEAQFAAMTETNRG